MNRRSFLRASGVALALPFLESTAPTQERTQPRRRILVVLYPLGLYAPNFFPQQPGHEYQLTRYLEHIQEFRNEFTVFSGLSHPHIIRSHAGDRSFLTGTSTNGRSCSATPFPWIRPRRPTWASPPVFRV